MGKRGASSVIHTGKICCNVQVQALTRLILVLVSHCRPEELVPDEA
jgi:hypothetical protein